MSDTDPTLRDVWRLLGAMNKRMGSMEKRFEQRFDALEREMVSFKADIAGRIGALKESIEPRDFRLDEHGRRLTRLEENLP